MWRAARRGGAAHEHPGEGDAAAQAARRVALELRSHPPAGLLGRALLRLLERVRHRARQRRAVLLDLRRVVEVVEQLARALRERVLRALEDLRDVLGHDELADRPDRDLGLPRHHVVGLAGDAAVDGHQLARLDLGLDPLPADLEAVLHARRRHGPLHAVGGPLDLDLGAADLGLPGHRAGDRRRHLRVVVAQRERGGDRAEVGEHRAQLRAHAGDVRRVAVLGEPQAERARAQAQVLLDLGRRDLVAHRRLAAVLERERQRARLGHELGDRAGDVAGLAVGLGERVEPVAHRLRRSVVVGEHGRRGGAGVERVGPRLRPDRVEREVTRQHPRHRRVARPALQLEQRRFGLGHGARSFATESARSSGRRTPLRMART